MKRVFLISIFVFLLFPFTHVKASCDFDELYKLNIIGSNIKYVYNYDKNNTVFDVKLYNVRKEVYLEYGDKIHNPTNGEVNLKNVDGSKDNEVKIYASGSTGCKGEYITVIPIKLPIYNEYFESDYCKENSYHKYCAKYLDSGVDITKIELEMDDEEGTDDVEDYLKSRKDEKITIKIKTTAKDIFTKRNMVLMVLIILLVLIIIAAIKKLKEIRKLKF